MDIVQVVLADDHPATCQGIRAALEEAPDIVVVGEAHDSAEAKALVAELNPDILLLDLVMPGLEPSEIERWVRHKHPETITLILTAHDRDAFLAEMEEAGAAGFLTKNEDLPNLTAAIRRAARGEALYTQKQLDRARRWRQEVRARWEHLTGREREALRPVVEGRTNQEIAQALGISEKTAGHHVSSVLGKLEVDSRTEAAVWAVKEGFIEQDEI